MCWWSWLCMECWRELEGIKIEPTMKKDPRYRMHYIIHKNYWTVSIIMNKLIQKIAFKWTQYTSKRPGTPPGGIWGSSHFFWISHLLIVNYQWRHFMIIQHVRNNSQAIYRWTPIINSYTHQKNIPGWTEKWRQLLNYHEFVPFPKNITFKGKKICLQNGLNIDLM